MKKNTLMQKMFTVSAATILSRMFGIIREVLTVRFLGAGIFSDAYVTAFKIPNSLRKAFADGALSVAFIPTIVQTNRKEGVQAVNHLMTLGFVVFEALVLVICVLVMMWPASVISWVAWGFSAQQVELTAHYLRILMPFIFFISSSALFAGALQAAGHFFVPAFGSVLMNIIFIATLIICLTCKLSIDFFCWGILFSGVLLLLSHLYQYIKLGFGFGTIRKEDVKTFGSVMLKFLACLPSVSMLELSLFIDTSFASALKPGTISLIQYANRFMGIPLGVFAVAFSTILLPHFSRVAYYAPKRLGFYLFESTKFVFWVTIPATIVMCFFAHKIFYTIFLSDKFTLAQVDEASILLIIFLIGLFFFSINKILVNAYYALHQTWVPAVVSVISTIMNIMCNYFMVQIWGSVGIVVATLLSCIVQTILFYAILAFYYKFPFYSNSLFKFMSTYVLQLILVTVPFFLLYYVVDMFIMLLPTHLVHLLQETLLFWFWAGPIIGLYALTIYLLRKRFGIYIYFLD